jgi:hypothetical protein
MLARIRRCPNGYFVEPAEMRTAQVLAAKGLILLEGMIATVTFAGKQA